MKTNKPKSDYKKAFSKKFPALGSLHQAMEEMECWSVQNHLKKCRKCATQARQEGIEEAEKELEDLDCGFCNYGEEVKLRLSELKKKELI